MKRLLAAIAASLFTLAMLAVPAPAEAAFTGWTNSRCDRQVCARILIVNTGGQLVIRTVERCGYTPRTVDGVQIAAYGSAGALLGVRSLGGFTPNICRQETLYPTGINVGGSACTDIVSTFQGQPGQYASRIRIAVNNSGAC